MKAKPTTSRWGRWTAVAWLLGLAVAGGGVPGGLAARASGVVTTNSTSALLEALRGGGSVTLNFNSTLILEVPLVIGTDTILEGSAASGRTVVLSGGGVLRVLRVLPGVRLELRNLELRDGLATNGGAVFNEGLLLASNVNFTACKAAGAVGGAGSDGAVRFGFGQDGTNGGPGQEAAGGAVYSTGEALFVDCDFRVNEATGGAGGAGGKGGVGAIHTGHGGSGGNGAGGWGGGIANLGRLVVSNSFFSGNVARGGAGGAGGSNGSSIGAGQGGAGSSAAGGAIHNAGWMLLAQASFTTNLVAGGTSAAAGAPFVNIGLDGADGGSAFGGAVSSWSTGMVVNTTFYTNLLAGGSGGAGAAGTFVVGDGGSGGDVRGAGLHGRGFLALTNVTFAWNTGTAGTGGGAAGGTNVVGNAGRAGRAAGSAFAVDSGTQATVVNSIHAAAGLSTVDGPIIDAGHNLFTDGGIQPAGAGTLVNTDPVLGAFQIWSVGAPGLLPLSGSPVADAADPAAAPPVDQRGLPRPGGVGPDIGALEVGVSAYSLSGFVFNGTQGLPGVAMRMGTNTVTTGADGSFRFGPLASGFYTVEPVDSEGFSPRLVQLSLSADVTNIVFQTFPVTLVLEHSNDTTTDSLEGLGVAGRSYRLEGSADLVTWRTLATKTADAQGRLAFVHDPGARSAWYYRLVSP